MIREITIGQYYSTESIIHNLDPRVKILGTLIYLISLFFSENVIAFFVPAVFFIGVVVLSKVPFSYVFRGLKPIVFILLFTAFLNLFWTPGREAFHIGAVSISWEGIEWMAVLSLRLILLMLGASVMTLTTTPNQLTDGIEKLLRPLGIFHVPVHEMAMMMSIALRFIPILVEETDRIMKAQAARGADFETGNVIQRIKSMLPVFVPLFVSAIRRANELALAMDARCYHGGKERTKLRPLRYQKADFTAYVILVAYFGIMLCVF